MLSDQIKGNVDVQIVSETKINDRFPNGNVLIDGFSMVSNDNGLILEAEAKPVEGFYIELNLCNDKWLRNFSCNSDKNKYRKPPQGAK